MALETHLTLRTVSDVDDLAELGVGWDELVRAMPRPSPYLLHGWVLAWWRAYGDRGRLAVQVAQRDERLVAALPLAVVPELGLRRLQFLGGEQSALADALLGRGEDPAVTRALLMRARASGHDYLDVFGLPGASRLAAALDPGDARLIERVEAPILDLDGGFPAIAARKLSPSRRKKLRQRRRRLERLGRLELAVCRTPAELDIAFTDALAVHRLRWRGRPDGSDLGTTAGGRFQRAALLELAKQDIPRIVTLRLDGRLIAFQYYFALTDRMYGHRGAFDPEFAAHSPGLICRYEALSAGADEGLRRVEFLGGGEEYKLELADDFDPLYQALGLARTVRGRAAVSTRLASIRLRQRLKRSNTIRRLYVDGLAPARRVADRVLPARRT